MVILWLLALAVGEEVLEDSLVVVLVDAAGGESDLVNFVRGEKFFSARRFLGAL